MRCADMSSRGWEGRREEYSVEAFDISTTEPPAESPAPRRSFFREVPWRWTDVLIGFAPMIVLGMAALLASFVIDPARLPVVPRVYVLLPLMALTQAWWLAYPLWTARRRHSGSPHLPRVRAVVVEALLALLAAPVVILTMSGVIQGLGHVFGQSEMPSDSPGQLALSSNRVESLGVLILALVAAPVAEEVFFRGMLYSALRRRLPVIVAAPIQAVIFALMHPFGWVYQAGIIVIGLALAGFYEWRKTLVAPVLLHALINAIAMSATLAGLTPEANPPRLGVYGERQDGGCRITQIAPGGAADAAGLQVGDVVTALDGKPVADILEMAQIIRRKRVGDRVEIQFNRGGAAQHIEAVLKPLPQ
jgi:membrane protease YdiL (CAAX protease family)